MLQSEQAWTGQFYSRPEFNTREGGEDFVSAMQQMEPYQIFSIKPMGAEPDEYGRDESAGLSPIRQARAPGGYPGTIMKFCPTCDQWRSVFEEQNRCSLCDTLCDLTQDAMSKLPEGCKSGLMGM
jgi:hypothetical protein